MGVTSATMLPLNMEILWVKVGKNLGKTRVPGVLRILLAESGALQGAKGENRRRQHVLTSQPSL
jgi:hypothetical protein